MRSAALETAAMLYAPVAVTEWFHLPVGEGHRLHGSLSGPHCAIPVIIVHGGPGGPWSDEERRLFDPAAFRVVGLDQRGAFRSEPLGSLEANTLKHLVADMEAARRYLGIEAWVVFGGSFGTALALHYAESHPERCLALILRSVMTGRPGFETWDFDGSRLLSPLSWQAMADACPVCSDKPLHERFFDALLADDATVKQALDAWYGHSGVLSGNSERRMPIAMPEFTEAMEIASARLAAHYWRNRLFVLSLAPCSPARIGSPASPASWSTGLPTATACRVRPTMSTADGRLRAFSLCQTLATRPSSRASRRRSSTLRTGCATGCLGRGLMHDRRAPSRPGRLRGPGR